MPPAHGKSYIHASIPGLVEADALCEHRGTTKLLQLISHAECSGDWTPYDKEWANHMKKIILDENIIVMVPTRSVGEQLGGVLLGVVQLDELQWLSNIGKRGKIMSDYARYRQSCSMTLRFNTNEDLQQWVRNTASHWLCMRPTTLMGWARVQGII